MLSASGGLSSPTVTVESTSNPSAYSFVIGNIQRNKQDYELEITADGKSAGIDRKQSETITIPAKDSFRFLSAERIDQPENGIQIVFSDPVSDAQDLKGLIEIPEISSYIFQVTDNRVNVYFEASQLSKLTLKIHEGIKRPRKSTGKLTLYLFWRTESETSGRNSLCRCHHSRLKKPCHSVPGRQPVCSRFAGYPHL